MPAANGEERPAGPGCGLVRVLGRARVRFGHPDLESPGLLDPVEQLAARPTPDRDQVVGLAGPVPARRRGVLDLHSAAGLPEGPLDEVAVADTGPVLGREPQVDGERGEIVGDTGDRRRIAGLPLGGERDGLALGNGDRPTAPATPSPTSKTAQKSALPRPGHGLTPWRGCCGRGGPARIQRGGWDRSACRRAE